MRRKYAFTLFLVIVFLCLVLAGCVTDRTREIQSQNYQRYLDKAAELAATPRTIWECTNCEIKGDIKVFQPNGGVSTENARSIQPPVEPRSPIESIITRGFDRAADIGLSTLPWYLAGKELGDVLKSFSNNMGRNTTISGSYNTSDSNNTSTSTTNTTNVNNSFNGDYRGFTGNVDQSDHSYNPVDNHSVTNPSPSEYVITPVITGGY